MKKYIPTLFLAIIIGFFLANFFIKQYDNYSGITVSNQVNDLYFIQYGVFSTIESMESETISLENYVYNIINDKYYVYVGISNKEEVANKIVNYYNSLGHKTIIKRYNISNSIFLEEINKIDSIMLNTDDKTAISSLINDALIKYEEVVVNGKN